MQAIDDVVSDRFPVTYEEAVHLAALRAHVTLGEHSDSINMMDYLSVKFKQLHLSLIIQFQVDHRALHPKTL